jgi:hemerythrin-like metal-binding protein
VQAWYLLGPLLSVSVGCFKRRSTTGDKTMTKLNWKPSYSVGVKQLDQQHERLLQLINEFSSENPDHSIKRCFVSLNEMIKYAQLHFASEEALLQQHNYEELSSHQKEHEAFMDKIFELNQKMADSGADIFPDLVMFLKDWYISHVLGTDKNYKSLLETQGVT